MYKKLAGKDASVDPVQMLWISELPKLLEEYHPGDIYNADETSLFYNRVPSVTLMLKGQSCHSGQKKKKARKKKFGID